MRALVTSDDAGFVEQLPTRLLAQDEAGRFDNESAFVMEHFRSQMNASEKALPRQ